MKLARNFSSNEYACIDSYCNLSGSEIDLYLVECQQSLRDNLNTFFFFEDCYVWIQITAGVRCDKKQIEIYRKMGRTPNMGSQHLEAQGFKASDFKCWLNVKGQFNIQIPPNAISVFMSDIKGFYKGGIGTYNYPSSSGGRVMFNHGDVRGYTARWGQGNKSWWSAERIDSYKDELIRKYSLRSLL